MFFFFDSRYYPPTKRDDSPEEAEVRRNFEAFKSPDLIATTFQPVLTMENELINQLEKISQNNVVLVFRDDSNEIGVFELIIEQALHLGYPSPLYMSAESSEIPALNQVVSQYQIKQMIPCFIFSNVSKILNCRKEKRWLVIDNAHLLSNKLYQLKLPPNISSEFRLFFISDHCYMPK